MCAVVWGVGVEAIHRQEQEMRSALVGELMMDVHLVDGLFGVARGSSEVGKGMLEKLDKREDVRRDCCARIAVV